ncbi:MAG: AraC family transcriptional regulator [Gammaproteobacteria bacterium]
MNSKNRAVSIIARVALLAGAWAATAALAAPDDAATTATAAATANTANTATAPKTAAPPATPPTTPPATSPAAATEEAAAAPEPGAPPAEFKTLDQEVQGLKKDVIDLNKDLFVLEEELLFPANTQVALYVSMDVGSFFALDSVTVKIDNKEVKNYLYTAREADALLKGGVQQIYLGNLKVGKHELVAFFTGKGPVDRDYKRGATINFDKGVGAKYLELKITDRVAKHQPEFTIKDWE